IYKGLLAVVLGMAALCSAHGQSVDSTDLYAADSATASQTLIKQGNSLQSSLSYFAVDSIYVDMKTRVAHLFSQSVVNYSGMKLEADYMEINLPLSEVLAQPTIDTDGMEIGIPHFTDKDNTFDAKEIRYNFRSKKGLIRNVMTQQGEIYVHGNMVKKYENDVTFVKNASFTSCDLEKPHFDLRAWRAKVVPDKVIAMGSAMLFIEDVPTPLVLPFALVPDMKKRKSGLIFPSFGQTQRAGFFFKGLGFYLNVSDYFDLGIEGDAYTSGNWEVRANLRYALRYKFSGNLNFGYTWTFQGERGIPNRPHQTGLKIQWSHSQDTKAHPNSRFSANVNFTNSTYSQYSGNLTDYLTNTTSSNISYSLDFARKLHLAVNANADYNT
ncbi:MAG: LPS-assembly protein LptD, partial [Bacteroidales bacterium]|nr:LPS-assembly protein LptD [Bacteroidales bacterium]